MLITNRVHSLTSCFKRNRLPIYSYFRFYSQFNIPYQHARTMSMGTDVPPGPMIWIDCEMTGLDLVKDKVIEIACYVTDGDLNLADPNGFEEVISCPKEILDGMDDWCTQHHGDSGLTAKVLACKNTTREVEIRLLKYLKEECGVTEARTGMLSGNSVHADKEFLRKEMPELIRYLHYRIIDVSTLKELARRRNPSLKARAPVKKYSHTAKSDILESIAELQFYYDNWLASDK
ncbi:ribonuclease H-like domain-containing protein [Lipomyces arxii]|uniref:ribonuclease H-like domain-containing protein n=1 Tax=Lipomyces arxii TaxID=56418 RepID=UPI0034CD79BD